MEQQTAAMQELSNQLRELNRALQRNGLGTAAGESGPGTGGVAGGGAGSAAHNAAAGGGDKPDLTRRQQAAMEGLQFVRQQRILTQAGAAVGSMADRYKSNYEKITDAGIEASAELAGAPIRAAGALPGISESIAEAGGEFVTQSVRTALQAADQANRTRAETMRGGLSQLENLAMSGVKISKGMMDRVAETYNERGGRLHDFRQSMAGAIDRQMGWSERDVANAIQNPQQVAHNMLFGGGTPGGVAGEQRDSAGGKNGSDIAALTGIMGGLTASIERLNANFEARGGVPQQ